jgi:mannose-1-phosphate guanylyltransferase
MDVVSQTLAALKRCNFIQLKRLVRVAAASTIAPYCFLHPGKAGREENHMTDVLAEPKIPVPVIIASDPLPSLWPLSTRERPFVFRPEESGVSPVQRLLLALARRPEFPAPILFAPDTAADAVMEQVSGIMPQTRVVFVPAIDNPGCIAVLAAMMNANSAHSRQLALLPANFHSPNLDAILDGVCVMSGRSAELQMPVALVRPVRAANDCVHGDIALEVCGRENKSRLPIGRVMTAEKLASDCEALIEMSAIVRSMGIYIGDGEAILRRAAAAHPAAYESCRLALTFADQDGSRLRSRLKFLSLARSIMIDDLIGAASLDLILHQVADTATLVRTLADIAPGRTECGAHSAPVIVEGYEDSRTFASSDGVLIIRKGFEHLARAHFDFGLAIPEAFTGRNYPPPARSIAI